METFTTSTTSYTAAARSAAPPSKRSNGVALIASGAVLGIVGGWGGYLLGASNTFGAPALNVGISVLVGLVLVIAGLVLTPLDVAYNRGVFPGLYAQWSRTWQCLRCGARFLI